MSASPRSALLFQRHAHAPRPKRGWLPALRSPLRLRMPQSQLVQVSLAGAPDLLLATFLDDSAIAQQLIEQLLGEDGPRIRQSVLGSPDAETDAADWAIQRCISSKPNAERIDQELQELEERA